MVASRSREHQETIESLEIKSLQGGIDPYRGADGGLGKAKETKEAHGEFESECPGYCGAENTFYVGTLEGVGRIYQQTFIDTYSKVATAKLYDRKTPITAADLLNDRVLPFFEEHEIVLSRIRPIEGRSTVGAKAMNMSCTWRWKISTTPGPRPKAPRLMGFVSAFTRRRSRLLPGTFRKKIYKTLEELQ